MPAPALELLDRHESGLFNLGAAEIVDFHPASRQVFVVSSKAGVVSVLELGARGFGRGEKLLRPGRDVPGFAVGQVTSLAVSGDLVAVALCARSNDERGRVAFYSASELRYLGAVTVGYVPDMLTFTPDGKKLLVANEGEQIRNREQRIVADPEGSVSIVDLSAGVARAGVTHATFERFDAHIEEYRNAGIRVPRLGDSYFEAGEGEVRLSRDLEPEYIAVAADGKTAWVSLQENDAVAVLDIDAGAFVELLPLGVKDFSVGLPSIESVPLPVGAFASDVRASSFARVALASPAPERAGAPLDLWFEPEESSRASKVFYLRRGSRVERQVLEGGQLRAAGQIALQLPAQAASAGLVRTRAGRTFVGDARRLAIYGFDAEGRLERELLPTAEAGWGGSLANAELGVAGLALDAARQRLYAVLQPANDAGGARLSRILALDVDEASGSFGRPVAQYLYLSDAARSGSDFRIAAATFERGAQLLLLEQPTGAGSSERARLFRVDLTGATDVLGVDASAGRPFEACSADELHATYGVELAHKLEVLALPEGSGAGPGLARVDDGRIALVAPAALLGSAGPVPGGPTALELVSFDDANRLDASDRDGKALLRHWPVFGAYMPDGIQSLRIGTRDYFVTANEGDTRHYDARRLADAELDPEHFPDATLLQSSAALGRLKVSAFDGDLDGDGDLDEIHTFGARSLSVWDSSGNLVFDTGSLFEEVTALALSDAFNSNNDENGSFDTRSDDKGPEPEGLEVAEIDGRVYAFVGLERVGGIVVLDLTDPRAVAFVEYVNPRDFTGSAPRGSARDLGPEGLTFVPAGQSPTGRGLLLVGNEVSGTTTAYDVHL